MVLKSDAYLFNLAKSWEKFFRGGLHHVPHALNVLVQIARRPLLEGERRGSTTLGALLFVLRRVNEGNPVELVDVAPFARRDEADRHALGLDRTFALMPVATAVELEAVFSLEGTTPWIL